MVSRSWASIVLLSVGLVAACTSTSSPPTIAPTSPVVTPTPTPSPTPTFGPNQTAALAVVTKYYAWINTYSKDPSFPNFGELQRLAKGDPVTMNVARVNNIGRAGQHQVGDLVLAQVVPDSDSPTQIGVAICVDATNVSRLDQAGNVVPRQDGLTRRGYNLKLRNDGGTWFVVSDVGGNYSC